MTGVIGAPAVTGVVGAAPAAVEAPVEDLQKPVAQVPGLTPRVSVALAVRLRAPVPVLRS